MDYLLATTNKGKTIEIGEVLQDLDISLISLFDLPELPVQPEEIGETFEENAVEKAKYYFDQTKMISIADDSGIHIDTLSGELGIHTRRWGAGEEASDEEWISYFLDRMRKEENKYAEFVSVIAIADGDSVKTFEGRCRGVITDDLEADYLPGLPISACFRPDGFDKVFSALSIEEKNSISHRGEAVGKLRKFIEGNIE
jgi:XTP/dITP diphosphohydrolase